MYSDSMGLCGGILDISCVVMWSTTAVGEVAQVPCQSSTDGIIAREWSVFKHH